MARRRRQEEDENLELDLAPIMNMVMILIPLLLLSTVFVKTGVVNISSPRNAQANTPEQEEREEETPVPRVVVYISQDGFRVGDQRNLPDFQPFTQPISRCGGGAAADGPVAPHDMANLPPTICLREGVSPDAPLVQKLDFPALYNQLVSIRLQPQWFDRFGEENNSVISILGDPEVPFDVLIKTMDTARFFLEPEGAGLGAPSASSNVQSYLLGDGTPTLEDLEEAKILVVNETERATLFPDPVLLLPKPSTGG